MMKKLTFDDLRDINSKRCEENYHRIEDWTPTDWACAMGGECGEALNLVKKLLRATGPTKRKTTSMLKTPKAAELLPAIGDELADTVIYADLLATRLGMKLGDCVRHKFNVTSKKLKSSRRI